MQWRAHSFARAAPTCQHPQWRNLHLATGTSGRTSSSCAGVQWYGLASRRLMYTVATEAGGTAAAQQVGKVSNTGKLAKPRLSPW